MAGVLIIAKTFASHLKKNHNYGSEINYLLFHIFLYH